MVREVCEGYPREYLSNHTIRTNRDMEFTTHCQVVTYISLVGLRIYGERSR